MTEINSLKCFADETLAACYGIAEDDGRRFGRKVFIAALGLSEAMRQRLVEAHRAGLLVLSRCDLVQVFDPELVKASEVRYLTGEFHFVAPR